MATGSIVSSGSIAVDHEQVVPYVKSNVQSDVNVPPKQIGFEAMEKVQGTETAGTQAKVSVVITANDDSDSDTGGKIEELEFKEEVGGYEDDEEDNFEDMEDENGPTEMDEEGGYKDEDEEFEDC